MENICCFCLLLRYSTVCQMNFSRSRADFPPNDRRTERARVCVCAWWKIKIESLVASTSLRLARLWPPISLYFFFRSLAASRRWPVRLYVQRTSCLSHRSADTERGDTVHPLKYAFAGRGERALRMKSKPERARVWVRAGECVRGARTSNKLTATVRVRCLSPSQSSRQQDARQRRRHRQRTRSMGGERASLRRVRSAQRSRHRRTASTCRGDCAGARTQANASFSVPRTLATVSNARRRGSGPRLPSSRSSRFGSTRARRRKSNDRRALGRESTRRRPERRRRAPRRAAIRKAETEETKMTNTMPECRATCTK